MSHAESMVVVHKSTGSKQMSELAWLVLGGGILFGWIAGFDTARNLYNRRPERLKPNRDRDKL